MINFNKNFFVYGLGISGLSVVKFFRNNSYNFKAIDDDPIKNKLLHKNEYCKNNNIIKELDNSSYIVVSPSINTTIHPILFKYKNKIIIDIDILGSLLSDKIKIIAITGTEGKSSVSNYLYNILKKKNKSILLGNIGKTVLQKKDIKNSINRYEYIIFELSSYQLDKVKHLKIDIGCITNLYPDHLKYHKSYNCYIKSKLLIKNILKKNGKILINKKTYKEINDNKIILSDNFNVYKNNFSHNYNTNSILSENLSTLFALMSSLGLKFNISDISKIKILPFRNQIIVNTKYLKIYNDSKSTNLLNSVMTFNTIKSKNKILILGGKLKDGFINLPNISNSVILIFGSDKNNFSNMLNCTKSKIIKFYNLDDLVLFLSLATKIDKNKKIILFSPGGESFDAYANFMDRGRRFNSLVNKFF